jgi:hypothetical protein
MRVRTMFGPVPVLSANPPVAEWKSILRKLSVGAAAECVISNFLYDPICDYGTSVAVLRRVLQAWAELELEDHGLARSDVSLLPAE